MRKTLAVFALLTPLALAPLRAFAGPTEDFRAKFSNEEQWMLDVILSDPAKKSVFDVSAVAAAKGAGDLERELATWRKTIVSFVQYYKKHLDSTDIVPDAPSVEKMVTPEEFNVTQYFWLRQPKAEQDGMRSDIATGNNLLGWGGRKLVEGKVRAGRVKFSGRLQGYLDDPTTKAALAWTPPPAPAPAPIAQQPPAPPAPQPAPKPKPNQPEPPTPIPGQNQPTTPPERQDSARDQLDNIARNGRPNGTSEGAAERSGSGYTGSGEHQGPPPSPVDVTAPGGPAPAPQQGSGLTPPTPGAGAPTGGFVVAPPAAPLADQNKPTQEGGSKLKIFAVKYGPGILGAVAGGLLFGLLAGLFLGPIGGVIAGLAGAALGYKAGQALGRKLLNTL